ncbi:MAG TPA: FtsW/RodA/SpoVE family cell cycle protein [Luteibaculaceae bacterium]|nr:FtsW/RodA/SpoVE family cell cycle protein [Luteibaculaceae bacterium]
MKKLFTYLKGDKAIWVVVVLLGLFSILAVYGSIVTLAVKNKGGDTEYYLIRHVIMLGLGFWVMYQAHRLKFTYYARIGQWLYWVAAGLLLLTLVKGTNLNNANRWLQIPIINQSFQTSDFAKIIIVLVVARLLAMRQEHVADYRKVLLPVLMYTGVVCALILPANFSTAALVFLVCFVMLFIGRIPGKQLLSVAGLGLGGILLMVGLATVAPDLLPRAKTWQNRLLNFNSGDEEGNYQVEHAKYAIASGGILPHGPGTGNSRNFLPHPYSDMIFAYIVEEYGSVVGGLGMLMLYLVLLLRSIQIAIKCPKLFGTFAALGLSLMLVIQALVNMSVAVNLIPVTGQPLPLVSMGGTSTLFTCLSIGIILSISRSVYEDLPDPEDNHEHKTTQYEVA